MDAALESLLADFVLGPAVASREALSTLCRERGVADADSAALCESFERLQVYRELVRGNLREALSLSIPRSIARLEQGFERYFDRFLLEQAPATHYLRDVTGEFLAFCQPLWAEDAAVPGYLYDLALHESLHIEVSALPTLRRGHVAAPLALDRGVALSEALRLVRYRHAVHELPADEADRCLPPERPVWLLVYRSPEHDVRYLELTQLAHGIVERLLAGQALGQAMRGAAEAAGAPLTEVVLAGAAKLLADLAERGVVFGPAPAAAGPIPQAGT